MAGTASIDDALGELVNQFSDPMSFLRELVQNAIDAGSDEVEVSVEWQHDDGDHGVTVIRVDDWGDGMSREIIETRLTRLFSSSKDGDMTKIGKFGIGFVSVFAIEPDAVCVDTSHEGESWRVVFDASRRYKLIRLEQPTEGTKIRVLKRTDRKEHASIEARAGKTLHHWCKHVTIDLRFQGKTINEPFDVPGIVKIDHDDGFSRIVVAHTGDGSSFMGFYNSGLTLWEGRDDEHYGGLAFKISSPHLEHTLTRDRVIVDAGYERMMHALDEIVAGSLRKKAFEGLARAQQDAALREQLPAWAAAVAWHVGRPDFEARPFRHVAVMRSPAGEPIELQRLGKARKGDVIYYTTGPADPLVAALEGRGLTVVAAADEAIVHLARALVPAGAEVEPVDQRWCVAIEPPAPLPAASTTVADALGELLAAAGWSVEQIAFGRLVGRDLGPAIAASLTEPLVDRANALALGPGVRHIVLEAGAPLVTDLLATAEREAWLPAYMLAKEILLRHGIEADALTDLLTTTLSRRWASSTS